MDKGHFTHHFLTKIRQFSMQTCLCYCVEFHSIRIDFFNLRPRAPCIPFIVAQVDVEDRRCCVNRLWIGNLKPPRETVYELRERNTIGTQRLRTFTGVIQMRHRKITGRGTIKRIKRFEMILHGSEHLISCNKVNVVLNFPIRRTYLNPLPNRGNRLLGHRGLVERHLCAICRRSEETLIELGGVWISGHNRPGSNQIGCRLNNKLFCKRAVGSMAAEAALLKDSIRLLCDVYLGICCSKSQSDECQDY